MKTLPRSFPPPPPIPRTEPGLVCSGPKSLNLPASGRTDERTFCKSKPRPLLATAFTESMNHLAQWLMQRFGPRVGDGCGLLGGRGSEGEGGLSGMGEGGGGSFGKAACCSGLRPPPLGHIGADTWRGS